MFDIYKSNMNYAHLYIYIYLYLFIYIYLFLESKVKLGNIEPHENIIIRLSYIELLNLETTREKYELILPFTLTPRYDSWKGKNQNNPINDLLFLEANDSNNGIY